MPGMRMVVRNLGSTPVTIDRAGHQLGAGEYGVASDSDHVTAAALAAGKIGQVLQPDDSADVDPRGDAAAFAQLADDDASAPADPPRATHLTVPRKARRRRPLERRATADAGHQDRRHHPLRSSVDRRPPPEVTLHIAALCERGPTAAFPDAAGPAVRRVHVLRRLPAPVRRPAAVRLGCSHRPDALRGRRPAAPRRSGRRCAATRGTLSLMDRAGVPVATLRVDALSQGAWSSRVSVQIRDGLLNNTFDLLVLYDASSRSSSS
jgi:hypothetical protein